MYLIKDKVIYSSERKEYFKYDLTEKHLTKITLEEYCKILFGKYNYKLRNLLGYANSIESDKIYSAFYQKFDLLIHNKEGDLLETKKSFFGSYTPYEIQVIEEKNEVWTATGGAQVVLCQEISTDKTIFQLGEPYEDDSELSYPESIHIYADSLFITEMGNRRILKLGLDSKEKSVYVEFEEPVWDFQKNEFAEIVLLDSGVYELISGKLIRMEIYY